MGIAFTEEQQKVIDTRGCNILVSAAAGSGKTAVLVERIVKMVSEGEKPADIDRLLIVTFTKAAADQMREKISNAIADKLILQPENEHLQKQAALLHNARITTIDSFCLFVIRNNFYTIGLDPAFRIADEGEIRLIKADVMASVLEKSYAKGDEDFLNCMEYFSTGSSDKAVEDAVFRLYEFAMSNPFPEEWLLDRDNDYAGADTLTELDWVQDLMDKTTLMLEGIVDQISQCISLCETGDGPYMYAGLLEQEKAMVEKALGAGSYEERYLIFDSLGFGRLPSKKDDTVSPGKRELVKDTRAQIKDRLMFIKKYYFAQSKEEVISQMKACGKAVSALVRLTLSFKEEFDAVKRDKNILDFDDIEHFALKILIERNENGDITATKTAKEFRDYFEEILTDEYQDSNLVQEFILEAISGEEDGRFNRFMVGDVKQSIYKFRLARPELFMEKYHAYAKEDKAADVTSVRIDLHKNFRSRKEVLTSVNALFSQIMIKELGGIEYDDNAALYPGAVYPEADEEKGGLSYDTELLLFEEDKGKNTVEAKDAAGQTAAGTQEPYAAGQTAAGMQDTYAAGQTAAGTQEPYAAGQTGARAQEAYGIAGKIRELVRTFRVKDDETGVYRKASYKDIVILLRATSGWDEEFKQVLEEENIPVHIESKTGYFNALEIRQMLHFLRMLDNPLQDIPFYGVFNSYFGGFTNEEAAVVKAAFPDKRYFYDAVVSYSKGEFNSGISPELVRDELRTKLSAFLEKIERYRDMAVYVPVDELLQIIIREYSYIDYVSAKAGGDRRRANVEMLLVKAADYRKTSYHGLYHFLRYMEQLEKYDVDYGEAGLQDENADVVRIMSIHKSKGLEFPICIVAGLAKGFNNMDTNAGLVMDVELGIGTDYVDPKLRIKSRNLRRNYIAAKLKEDNLAEELRILYVAMTRAKEKLILTGVLKNPEKKISSLQFILNIKERSFSYDRLLQAGSFMDILLCAAARNRCFDEIFAGFGIEPDKDNPCHDEDMSLTVSLVKPEDTLENKLDETIRREDNRRRLLQPADPDMVDEKIMTLMSEKFSYRYPYENLKDLYTKTTVSELKKAGMHEETDYSFRLYEEETIVPYLPSFIQNDTGVSGTDRGSAYHKVMELLDFNALTNIVKGTAAAENISQTSDIIRMLEETVRSDMKRMLEEGRLSGAYYDAVQVSKIAAFLQSDIARRMIKAAGKGSLYREQPFVLGLSADRLNESFPPQETVLIQGIIDVFFEEDGKYVVLDYKTDLVNTPQELIDRYKTQLCYYAKAIEQILEGKEQSSDVSDTKIEKVIYSFALGTEIKIV